MCFSTVLPARLSAVKFVFPPFPHSVWGSRLWTSFILEMGGQTPSLSSWVLSSPWDQASSYTSQSGCWCCVPQPPSLSRKASDGFFSSFRISGPSCLLGQRTAVLQRWLIWGSSCVHLDSNWQTWANARYGSAPASWRNRVFSLQ